jgi:hypothetical protein
MTGTGDSAINFKLLCNCGKFITAADADGHARVREHFVANSLKNCTTGLCELQFFAGGIVNVAGNSLK